MGDRSTSARSAWRPATNGRGYDHVDDDDDVPLLPVGGPHTKQPSIQTAEAQGLVFNGGLDTVPSWARPLSSRGLEAARPAIDITGSATGPSQSRQPTLPRKTRQSEQAGGLEFPHDVESQHLFNGLMGGHSVFCCGTSLQDRILSAKAELQASVDRQQNLYQEVTPEELLSGILLPDEQVLGVFLPCRQVKCVALEIDQLNAQVILTSHRVVFLKSSFARRAELIKATSENGTCVASSWRLTVTAEDGLFFIPDANKKYNWSAFYIALLYHTNGIHFQAAIFSGTYYCGFGRFLGCGRLGRKIS